jgi:hypothetical protein
MSKYEKEFKKVSAMCQVLEVSRSKYYEWLQSPVSERKKKDEILQSQIRIIHNKSNKRYIHSALKDQGEPVSRKRVARYERKQNSFNQQETLQSDHQFKAFVSRLF